MFDPALAQQFIDAIGKNGTTRIRCFRPKGQGGGGAEKADLFLPDGSVNVTTVQQWHNGRKGTYFVVNDGGDTKASITEIIGYFAEFDEGTKEEQLKRLNSSVLPSASYVIDNGGKSLHIYWIFDQPIICRAVPDCPNKKQWSKEQDRINTLLGSDPAVKDPSRVMRLPGAWYVNGDGSFGGQARVFGGTGKRVSRKAFLECLPEIEASTPQLPLQPPSTQPPAKSTASDDQRTRRRIQDQLQRVAPRVPGSGTRNKYTKLLWAMADALGDADAAALMAAHSPQWAAAEDLLKKCGERTPGTVSAASFFHLTKTEWGITDPPKAAVGAADDWFKPQQQQPPEEQKKDPTTYSDWVRNTVDAIVRADVDCEMMCRARLKEQFRITDNAIEAALLRHYSNSKLAKVERAADSVDYSRVQLLSYLQQGWVPEADIALVYGPYGTGKTTLALHSMVEHCKGSSILDRAADNTPGRGLFIASDGGAAALYKSMDDLDIDPTTDPMFIPGHPEQRIWTWAYEPEQGHDAWSCTLSEIIRLERFIAERGITYVVIDSAKKVSATAGWSYTDNQIVTALLVYLRNVLCKGTGAGVWMLSHDGTERGAHAGAKAWAEEPSIVIALCKAEDENGNRIGVQAQFKKDRCAKLNANRSLTYELRNSALHVLPEVEIVGNCRDAVAAVLWEQHQKGVKHMRRIDLIDAVMAKFGRSRSTVDDTLSQFPRHGRGPAAPPVYRPQRGFYALTPAEVQRRTLRQSTDASGAS